MNRKQYILETLDRQNITEISAMDAIHLGLDGLGMIPGYGIAADLANAALYGVKGQGGMAALSLGAAVPVVGLGVGAAKLAGKALPTVAKGLKAAAPTSKATKSVGKAKDVLAKSNVDAKNAVAGARKSRKAEADVIKAKDKVDFSDNLDPNVIGPTRGNMKAYSKSLKKADKAGTVADTTKTLETALKSRRVAQTGAEAAMKNAGRSAAGSRLVKSSAKLAGNRQFGLQRAAVLGREEIGAATGMEMGDAQAFRFKEGQSLVNKTVSGITDALKNLPDLQKSLKPLEDYKLGSFQS